MRLKNIILFFVKLFAFQKMCLTRVSFKDVAIWDSVSHLSLISRLEDAFDVMFDADDILHFGSYLNGIEILKRYGVEF